MLIDLKYADGDGCDGVKQGSYIEYELTVEADIRDGGPPAHGDDGWPPEINWYRVADVDSMTCYPLGCQYGYRVPVMHQEPHAYAVLLAALNVALHEDESVGERLLDAWERERCVA